VLFDPHAIGLNERRFKRVGSWLELTDHVFAREDP
jgi:hypothetical protein